MSTLRHSVTKEWVEISEFVIMTDHWHALVGMARIQSLSGWMHKLMSFLGARTILAVNAVGCRWQDGFYETEIRTLKQFRATGSYIVNNPVRNGLVQTPEDWAHSSARSPEWTTLDWPGLGS